MGDGAGYIGPSVRTAEVKVSQKDARRLEDRPQTDLEVTGNPEESTQSAPLELETEALNQLHIDKDDLTTDARVAEDGRIHINIHHSSRRLAKLFRLAQTKQAPDPKENRNYHSSELSPPRMNIVIQVVGSRGDVQPFIALGKTLKEQYQHRVRLATHATFKGFIEDNGLEFYNIGGDPAQLMAFMVKNPSLVPGLKSLREGDVGKRQREISDILIGCWRSCIESGDGIDGDSWPEESQPRPFIADVIIANPPSFAHIHCAEKLGVPIHLMFTMPWSPTQAFPHPLANIKSSNADSNLSNLLSYTLVEGLTWQGLGPIINRFRQQCLHLEPISLIWAPYLLNRLRIPYTYCWSPALIPKPDDWEHHIDISGFFFLSAASSFVPDPGLQAFLDAGPPPIYIGFGSIVVDDPDAMTSMVFRGGNVPHDWIFKHVSREVHHGGAGTTAAGIALGKPTVIVPFFGDQPFWGAMIARAGAGSSPVPYSHMNADILAGLITKALLPSMQEKAASLAATIAQEKGNEDGANSFHNQLKLDGLRCSISPDRIGVWRVRHSKIRLSALAATVLIDQGLLKPENIRLFRAQEYDTRSEPTDPISALVSGTIGSIGDIVMTAVDLPVSSIKGIQNLGRMHHHAQIGGSGDKILTAASTALSRDSTLVNKKPNRLDSTLTAYGTIPDQHAEQLLPTPDAERSPSPDFANEVESALRQNSQASKIVAFDPDSMGHRPDTSSRATTEASSSSSFSTPAVTPQSTLSSSTSARITLSASNPRAPIVHRKMEKSPAEITGRFLYGVFKSPMELDLHLTRGFHNAPKLYGDTTVRQPDKVTDLNSGVKQAGKELVYGLYDGVTGLVTQPVEGASKEGMTGFVKGVGKGLGGAFFKPGAAILGAPSYTWKGIYKELRKSRGKKLGEYMMAIRTADGIEDWYASTEQERELIVQRWHDVASKVSK